MQILLISIKFRIRITLEIKLNVNIFSYLLTLLLKIPERIVLASRSHQKRVIIDEVSTVVNDDPLSSVINKLENDFHVRLSTSFIF